MRMKTEMQMSVLKENGTRKPEKDNKRKWKTENLGEFKNAFKTVLAVGITPKYRFTCLVSDVVTISY